MSTEDGLGLSIGEKNFSVNTITERNCVHSGDDEIPYTGACFGEVHVLLRKGHYDIVYKSILPSSTSQESQGSSCAGVRWC